MPVAPLSVVMRTKPMNSVANVSMRSMRIGPPGVDPEGSIHLDDKRV